MPNSTPNQPKPAGLALERDPGEAIILHRNGEAIGTISVTHVRGEETVGLALNFPRSIDIDRYEVFVEKAVG